MKHAQAADLWPAAGAVLLTYIAAALTYCLLAIKPLHYLRTLVVQFAAMFVNRFFPAGVGGIGTNYEYLRKQKHSAVQAGTVVAVNNGLGFVGHSLLFWVLLALFHSRLPAPAHTNYVWFVLGLLVVIAGVLIFGQSKRGQKIGRNFVRQLATYRRRPQRVALALLSSICLTLGNVGAFYYCALSLGVTI